MKLELFDFIDDVIELMESRQEEIDKAAKKLSLFFNDAFLGKDHFLHVTYRIKSPESLREKILRNNFYVRYETPEILFDELSDIIGFRIECRFIQDETRIFEEIKKVFKIKCDNGFYTNSLNSKIKLKLDEKQPMLQKNGFEIYKIDGKYCESSMCINFELQIKSMVNTFWGEIDHRVLYKNFNYMLTEDFFRNIMMSIKDNLYLIDRQLMVVYNHLNKMDTTNDDSKEIQLQGLLSKIIHDIYITKLRDETGFVLDFKKSTDLIVKYLFMKVGQKDTKNYSENFINNIQRLGVISNSNLSFTSYISFDREIFFNDSFTRSIGNSILEVLNRDFRWNLFFRIIFEIEDDHHAETFERFLIFIRYQFSEPLNLILEGIKLNAEEKNKIFSVVMDAISDYFVNNPELDFICNISTELLNEKIVSKFKTVNNYLDWLAIRGEVIDVIKNHNCN